MIAAIGFLAAALIALLIIPAVNARAERLARRRVEALFPLSISELTAEKDHLRAEFAVTQRRLERKAEEALAAKRQDMEELGRRAVRVEALDDRGEGARRAHRRARRGAGGSSRAAWRRPRRSSAAPRPTSPPSATPSSALEGAHRATLDELGVARGRARRRRRRRSPRRGRQLAGRARRARRPRGERPRHRGAAGAGPRRDRRRARPHRRPGNAARDADGARRRVRARRRRAPHGDVRRRASAWPTCPRRSAAEEERSRDLCRSACAP